MPLEEGAEALTYAGARREATRQLEAAGIDTPALDARVLLGEASGLDGAALLSRDREALPQAVSRRYDALIRRRLAREPVAYITGVREFWGRTFLVSPDGLIPRADSEVLVAEALAHLDPPGTPVRVLDLGVGSGCLLVSLLADRPQAVGIGVDIEAGALALTRRNCELHGVSPRALLVQGHWAAGLAGSFDVILANPPYIPSSDVDALSRDVRCFEPRRALDGGPDGVRDLAQILADLPRLLTRGGVAVMEFGAGQEDLIADLAAHVPDLRLEKIAQDLAGRPRCAVLRNAGSGLS